MAEEKKPKVYKLRKFKECPKCRKPLTSDKDELCAVCALEAAKNLAQKTAKERDALQGTKEAALPPKATAIHEATDPGPTTLDLMKEILAEVEKQNLEDEKIAEEVKKRFSITDMGSANWAAGKIAMWQNEVERRKAQAKEFIAEAERNARRLNFLFKGQLEVWAKANIPHDKKSIKLPLATLKFSDTQEKIEIVDEEKTVAWATINCENAVTMKAELQVLKDLWLKSEKKTVPDGCAVVPKETNFKVE